MVETYKVKQMELWQIIDLGDSENPIKATKFSESEVMEEYGRLVYDNVINPDETVVKPLELNINEKMLGNS